MTTKTRQRLVIKDWFVSILLPLPLILILIRILSCFAANKLVSLANNTGSKVAVDASLFHFLFPILLCSPKVGGLAEAQLLFDFVSKRANAKSESFSKFLLLPKCGFTKIRSNKVGNVEIASYFCFCFLYFLSQRSPWNKQIVSKVMPTTTTNLAL